MSERNIVERLRAPAYWISGSSEGHDGENDAPLEAAAEILRLRSELAARAVPDEEVVELGASTMWARRSNPNGEPDPMQEIAISMFRRDMTAVMQALRAAGFTVIRTQEARDGGE